MLDRIKLGMQVILAKPRAEVSKKGEAYRKWLCHIQFNLSVILLFYWDLYFCTKRFYCHVLENSCTCTRHAAITKSLSTCKKTTKRTLAHAFFCHGLVTSPCVVNRDTRMDQELSVQSRATGPRDESVACMSSRTLCTQVAIFARVSAKGKQLFCWRHSSKHCCNVCNSSMCSLCTRPKWCICGLYFAFRVYPGATDVNGRVSSLGFASQVRAKLASAKATVRLWNEVSRSFGSTIVSHNQRQISLQASTSSSERHDKWKITSASVKSSIARGSAQKAIFLFV